VDTKLKLMVVAAMAGIVLVATAVPAAADTGDEARQQYREAMWYFVPTLGQWSRELTDAVTVAQIKPEQVCPVVLPALAYRGQGMVEDLQGTVPVDEMTDTHAQLIGTVQEMTAIAQSACESPSAYADGLKFEATQLNHSRHTLLSWLLINVEPIQDPTRPVVGN
jgi:hypothetical protein